MLPDYEGWDAQIGHLQLAADSPRRRGFDLEMWLLFFALSLKRVWRLPLKRRSRAALPEAAGAVVFRIRCAWVGCAPRVKAASVRRLAGAETALFHYHRYFAGSQGPDGEPI